MTRARDPPPVLGRGVANSIRQTTVLLERVFARQLGDLRDPLQIHDMRHESETGKNRMHREVHHAVVAIRPDNTGGSERDGKELVHVP